MPAARSGKPVRMAEYTGTVETPMAPDAAFAYMADFSNVDEWDPNCERAEKVTPGEVGPGTEFRMLFSMGPGQTTEFTVKVTEWEAPRRMEIEGGSDHLHLRDTVEVAPAAAGAEITYTARIEGTGAAKVANPILGLGLSRAGSQARDGLEQRLNPS